VGRSAEGVPLYDEDAETALVGSVILDPGCLNGADIDPDDFFVEDYRRLWEAILALRYRGAEINQATVAREANIEMWILQKVITEALPIEALHYAAVVKEKSRQRRLVGSLERAMKEFRKNQLSSRELADQLQLCLNTLDFPTSSSRVITITHPKIVETHPPTYELTVSAPNGQVSAAIKVTSAELDQPQVFRRKVREQLKINPILPKPFDAFVHQVLQQAEMVPGAGDASRDESICYWIREWFSTASEADSKDDLSQGYLDRDGAYWFLAERLIGYVSERSKVNLDRSLLWSVIHDRGGRRSKVFSIGGRKVRLWGIGKPFFEENEPADEQQFALEEPEQEDDFRWLEGEDG